MKAIRSIFKLINNILQGTINLTDEVIAWTDEVIQESKAARAELAEDRVKEKEEEKELANG